MKKAMKLKIRIVSVLIYCVMLICPPPLAIAENKVVVIPLRNTNQGPPAPVPKTGQVTTYAVGDDGDHMAGIAAPSPRFTDNGNGTVTDNLTGLVWLKDGNCIVFS